MESDGEREIERNREGENDIVIDIGTEEQEQEQEQETIDPLLEGIAPGQIVFAKTPTAKLWGLATVLSVDSSLKIVTIRWMDTESEATVPLVVDCIQSTQEKRKRKLRVQLDEDEDAYREAVGLKKKSRKSIDAPVASIEEKNDEETTNAVSANAKFLKETEAMIDSSLKEHLPLLKPFITSKIYDRIQSAPDSEIHPHHISTQPRNIVKATLRDYQIRGVSFLVNHYLKAINCILADEMGLGKTLQTISYISYLTHELNIPGPHLIVVPLSVLFNWILEFRTYCPSIRILRLHSNSPQDQQRLREVLRTLSRFTESLAETENAPNNSSCPYDVVITTYEMVKGKLEGSLKRVYWRTMVLDEGHRIKNDEALVSKACLHYKARSKIILTGTPVQNNLHETFSILHYLHPTVFQTSESFDSAFQFNGSEIHVDQHLVDRAHYLLRVFLLRRIKTEVEQKLPPKLETVIKCPMSRMQKFWSKRLLLRDSELLHAMEEKFSSGDKIKVEGNAWKKLQSLLAQLRKAANHPYLFPEAEDLSYTDDPTPGATEEIVTASGKMMMLDRLLFHLHESGHRVVLFSQYTRTLDIIQDYLEMRGYKYTRLDGSTHRVNREVRITQFNRNGSSTFIFLLSTRAGGEGVNLYTADTVILFDSDWNPQVDIQAMARVHRIGQTKVVHIYRFVTTGTVEERIVQRAQKKLYLDSLVNRGSTSQAIELDKLREQKSETNDSMNKDPDADSEDLSTVMSALKFGYSAVFSKDQTESAEDDVSVENVITDEEIYAIIDRRRGLQPHQLEHAPVLKRSKSLPAKSHRGKRSELKQGGDNHDPIDLTQDDETSAPSLTRATSLREDQEENVASFHRQLSIPLTNLRCLDGEYLGKGTSPDRNIQSSHIQVEDAEIAPNLESKEGEEQNESILEEEKLPTPRMKKAASGSLRSIASEWAQENGKRSNREKKSRTELVHVVGVGRVSILKVNKYSLEEGEPSVFQREIKGRVSNVWGKDPSRTKKYEHQDICQLCWDGGNIICCNYCPASYHPACVGLKKIPSGSWTCPHHGGCAVCSKSNAAMGFSFRCEACPNVYCEDCLPTSSEILEGCARWTSLGFNTPSNCCFIQCSEDCVSHMAGQIA